MSLFDPLSSPDKVTITTLDADLEETGTSVSVPYNPTEYSIERGATYADQSLLGLSTPVTQFVNGDAESLSMELFFDTYERGGGVPPTGERDVRTETRKLTDLLTVDPERHAPPVVKVAWGTFVDFVGVLERATTRFTLFFDDGTPARARMDVTFKQYGRPTRESAETPRNSADRTKRRSVVEGETLPLVAAREYGDPAHWRVIAAANHIDDPRTLAAGRTLVLPPLED